jgi:hypothetical protein
MFIKRDYFERILREIGLEIKKYGNLDQRVCMRDYLVDEVRKIRDIENIVRLLLQHLGLEYQSTCRETLPKLNKINKEGK